MRDKYYVLILLLSALLILVLWLTDFVELVTAVIVQTLVLLPFLMKHVRSPRRPPLAIFGIDMTYGVAPRDARHKAEAREIPT